MIGHLSFSDRLIFAFWSLATLVCAFLTVVSDCNTSVRAFMSVYCLGWSIGFGLPALTGRVEVC